MKRIILALFIGFVFAATIANAVAIDKNSVEIKFEGFKTPKMVGLEGKFSDVEYVFSNDTSSIASALKGASAVIKTYSLDTGVEQANKNLINVFFKTLIGNNDIRVIFKEVIEGDNVGVIIAHVNMETKRKDILLPLTYTVQDGKLEAKGVLNLYTFKSAKKALEALSKAAPGHEGISWPLVNVTFSANIM